MRNIRNHASEAHVAVFFVYFLISRDTCSLPVTIIFQGPKYPLLQFLPSVTSRLKSGETGVVFPLRPGHCFPVPGAKSLTPNQRRHNVVCGGAAGAESTLAEENIHPVSYCALGWIFPSVLPPVRRCLYYCGIISSVPSEETVAQGEY